MTLQMKSPAPRCGAETRLLETSSSDALAPAARAEQAEFERLLEIKRGSIFRVGCGAYAQLEDMLGALEIADDELAWYHCKSAVSHVRAVAKLVNDLFETRRCGQ
jgi:aspartate aminotransferase-like enzyme